MYSIKRIGISAVVIAVMLAISTASANDFSYYSFGEQIIVEPSDSLVTVSLEGRLSPMEIDHPCIDQSYPPEPTSATSWTYHCTGSAGIGILLSIS